MKRFIAFQNPINSNDLKEYNVCVITAANNYQAKGYQEQLRWRKDRGVLLENTEFLVFADPQGKRIGSGGSTIYVLYKLLEHFCENHHEKYQSLHEPFQGKRILILHSGGDSRRLPAYSTVGKIFIPLPTSFSTDGFVTLFDLLLNNLMQLPCLDDGQVVVASGDVLLSFDASKVAFSDSGVTGLAYPGPVEVASNHGVYIVPQTQSGENLRKVVDFLQKPTYDELEKCNGLDTANRAFIDTGVMNFGIDAIKVLMDTSGVSIEDGKVVVEKDSLCENLINANVQLDIYKEIPFAMLGRGRRKAEGGRRKDYQSPITRRGEAAVHEQESIEEKETALFSFTNALQQIPFSVYLLPYCEFFHIGTSKQLLQNFHTINYTASTYGFQNFSKSKALDKSGLGNAFVYNSLINTASVKVNGPSLIEGCYLEGEILLEGDNILTGFPKGAGNIKLQKGICVTCLPVFASLRRFTEGEVVSEAKQSLLNEVNSLLRKPPSSTQTGIPVYNRVEHGLLDSKEREVKEGECGWVSIIYGIEDDFKKLAEDNTDTFLNDHKPKGAGYNPARTVNEVNTFLNWMENRGISPINLWEDNEPHELWNARLFPFSTDPAESMRISLSLQDKENFQSRPDYIGINCAGSRESGLDKWKKSPRMSLREILESIDYERLLNHYSNLCQKVNMESLATILTPKSNLPSEEILSWCVETGDYTIAAKNTLALIEQSEDILFQARLYKLLSNILRKANEHKKHLDFETKVTSALSLQQVVSDLRPRQSGLNTRSVGSPSSTDDLASLSESLEYFAFELVCEAIGKGLTLEHRSQRIQMRSDEVVWVCAPARLDFAGGWSDTPPYCLEHGGSVLNAAVKLNGQYPIQVIGKLHPEPFIKINSIDLGERITVSETSEMLAYQDPTNWSALPKTAFVVTGIIPEDTELDLQDTLKELGSGIDLTLFSAVPSGSGLGTSSILGSAIIACLSRMLGQELTQEDLFNRTLYMEQLMTTGGGWQDQIGGVVGGVKHITTDPGLFQTPRISWTDLNVRPNMDLSERFLLYYTGLRRLAKNILRNIVGKYLDRDPVTLKTISQLREKSFEMKEELDHRNIDAFGKKIAEVWELNKTLDPGTSNEEIEAILSKISPLIHGAKLLGAGGGGFLFIVTKGTSETQKVKQILTDEPPNNRARFFDFDIDKDGLKVNVL